jgi:hypothetical protein
VEHAPEVLEHEAPRPVPGWVWIGLVVVLLVGAAGWAVDEHRRGREDTALAHCRAQLLTADQAAGSRLGRVADYLRPSLASLPPDLAYRLADPMRSPAQIALPQVLAAAEVCHSVEVWGWHEPSHARRDATVAYADQLLARLRLIAAHGGAYFDSDEQLDRLRASADLS